ncbi:sensor histidine kinase [Maribacter algicola]|uniref:Sensor histidine kinase n=1 Tax=Meishania litoralis TaxID=3434685 RepID=A0ACC7LKS4_9FLAO
MRKHLSLLFIGFLLGILTYGFVHFNGFQNITESVLSGLLGILLAYSIHLSNKYLNMVIPWKKLPGLRLLAGISLHMSIGLLLVFGMLWGYHRSLGQPHLFVEDPDDVLMKIGILLFCTVLIYDIIYFAFYSYFEYSKGQVMQVKLQRKQAQLQLGALKSQLSPHFLFNGMNTLSSLFLTDTEKAEDFIRSLASSYEYVLGNYGSALVTVAKELTFVDAYSFLMRTRFGEYLNLDVQLDAATLKTKIPPLTLQMLVENAVKHNVIGPSQILNVKMATKGEKLIVSNNKTNERPNVESLKIGLRNIASRYNLVADKSIEIIDGNEFTVVLPLIP